MAFEMSAKQPPHWFYTILRSKRGSKKENYQELAGGGEEHGKNSRSLTQIYPTRRKEHTDVGVRRGSLDGSG